MENPSKVKVLLLKVNSCYPTPGGLGSALSGIPLNCINWLCFSFTYSFFLGARKSLITVKCYCRARERELQGIYNRDACFQRPVNEAFVSSGHTSPRLWCPLTPFRPSCPTPNPLLLWRGAYWAMTTHISPPLHHLLLCPSVLLASGPKTQVSCAESSPSLSLSLSPLSGRVISKRHLCVI